MLFTNIFLFIISCFFLVFAAKWLLDALTQIARYLGWKEFVVAFFTVSLGAVAPEFFIGISSAIHGIPELSLGNIIGQNILLFSFTVGVCAIVLKNGLEVESKTVRAGSTFAVVAALLPLFLILDGTLSRLDGIILLLFFLFFVFWLFSKKERFTKIYDGQVEKEHGKEFICFIRNTGILLVGVFFLVFSAEGIIRASFFFGEALGISLPFIGIVIVAIGVGLPETYFALALAKKGQSWMILGGLMGAVAMSSTLVLGVVSLINPITIEFGEFSSLFIARGFLLVCSLLFLFFVRSGKRISSKEGVILIMIYVSFLILEILLH